MDRMLVLRRAPEPIKLELVSEVSLVNDTARSASAGLVLNMSLDANVNISWYPINQRLPLLATGTSFTKSLHAKFQVLLQHTDVWSVSTRLVFRWNSEVNRRLESAFLPVCRLQQILAIFSPSAHQKYDATVLNWRISNKFHGLFPWISVLELFCAGFKPTEAASCGRTEEEIKDYWFYKLRNELRRRDELCLRIFFLRTGHHFRQSWETEYTGRVSAGLECWKRTAFRFDQPLIQYWFTGSTWMRLT